MQVNISGFGARITLIASSTFPQGFTLSQFADDADSLDIPELAIADSGMGLNGTHVVWSKPGVIDLTLNMVPTTVEDKNLEILHEANRVAEGKSVAGDVVTLSIAYANGAVVTLAEGIIVSGAPTLGISQAGRLKTRPYKFRFTKLGKTAAPMGA